MSRENIAIRILETAAARPDHLAMVFDEHQMTYGQLSLTARQWAQALAEAGVEPGQMVGIALRDFVDNFVARVAVWLLDATPVPLDVTGNAAQRRALFETFGMRRIIEDAPSFDDDRSIVVSADWQAAAAARDGDIALPAETTAMGSVTLTSGTTGASAGIAAGHDSILRVMKMFAAAGMAHPDACFLNTAWHTVPGNNYMTYAMLQQGATIEFCPSMAGAAALTAKAGAAGATMMFITPVIMRDLVAHARASNTIPLLPGVTHLSVGGAPVSTDQLIEAREALGPGMLQMYGAASAGAVSILLGRDFDTRGHTLGRAFEGVVVETVDDDDTPTAPGTPGRLRISSPALASTVLGPVRQTGDMIRDGWCYPGDIGVIDDEGFITLLGREGDVINCGGAKIHPAEVELVLSGAPGLREVSVVGVPSDRHGQEPVAFVVTDPGVTTADLEAHCRRHLEATKRPRRFVFRDELPRNQGGKVVKRELVASLGA